MNPCLRHGIRFAHPCLRHGFTTCRGLRPRTPAARGFAASRVPVQLTHHQSQYLLFLHSLQRGLFYSQLTFKFLSLSIYFQFLTFPVYISPVLKLIHLYISIICLFNSLHLYISSAQLFLSIYFQFLTPHVYIFPVLKFTHLYVSSP